MKLPAASKTTTGGAAIASSSGGSVSGRCRTQTLSSASMAMLDAAPSFIPSGTVGHAGSTSKTGRPRPCCAAAPADIADPDSQAGAAAASAATTDARKTARGKRLRCMVASHGPDIIKALPTRNDTTVAPGGKRRVDTPERIRNHRGLQGGEMPEIGRKRLIVCLVGICLAAASVAAAQTADEWEPVTAERLLDPQDGDWMSYRRTYDVTGFSPLDQINRSNVGDLRLVWAYSMRDVTGWVPTPVVANGLMYVSEGSGRVTAFDVVSGDVAWVHTRSYPTSSGRRRSCGTGACRSTATRSTGARRTPRWSPSTPAPGSSAGK